MLSARGVEVTYETVRRFSFLRRPPNGFEKESRCDWCAAQRLMRKLLRKYGVALRALIANMLKSYAAENQAM
ncbi:MAG: hypothetical protein KA173_00960 [Rhodoferax sp.]|nr:hypothetical protein [Rhodoferax sp.]MBP7490516.1 hypothetical protein [Rhodoferax sp.]